MNDNDYSNDPAVIEREIAHKRASLQRKLDELQHRLNPRERVRAETDRVKDAVRNIDPTPYTGAAALAAVGIGAAMAVRGLRRRNNHHDVITPGEADLAGE
jgi:hypothetical protein